VTNFVTIANLAASALGEDDQLRSPDDDTHLSRSVRAVWDVERKAAIRDHSWNFAMARKALPRLVTSDDTYPYAFAYQLPSDNLRLIEVVGFHARDYACEADRILSNAAAPLRIRYLRDVAEPARWDGMFVKAFAMRVAWQIADRITGDTTRAQLAERRYMAVLREAKRVDARENPPIPHEATGWELSRGSGGERIDRNGLVWP
jgi:hypothetical protein